MSRPDVPAQPALNALLLPLLGRTLLLPSVALAELVNLLPVEPVEPGGAAAPAWYLGAVRWRERRVPLLSFEAAATGGAPPALRRIAVLHALGGHGGWISLPWRCRACRGPARSSPTWRPAAKPAPRWSWRR